jgi:hypothetical protein
MSRPLTRIQAVQNCAFLKALRRTGNVRLACRELGLKYGTMQHRRRVNPALALRWDAALAFAWASFDKRGPVGPSAGRPRCSPLRLARYGGRGVEGPSTIRSAANGPPPLRTQGRMFRTVGGEPVMVRTRNGKLQVQRAKAGKLTREAEQAFLSAVSATCNLSLAAAAVGSCFKAFDRRRKTDPAFARELRMALKRGYEALELALMESSLPASHDHDEWRHNDPPAVPPMSVNQAMQLMYLHQKNVLQLDEPDYLKRRRGEPHALHMERLAQMA